MHKEIKAIPHSSTIPLYIANDAIKTYLVPLINKFRNSTKSHHQSEARMLQGCLSSIDEAFNSFQEENVRLRTQNATIVEAYSDILDLIPQIIETTEARVKFAEFLIMRHKKTAERVGGNE